jgi:hypothetical protein
MADEYEKAADLREIADLRELARRARYAAWQISDKEAARRLMRDAEELEGRADTVEFKYQPVPEPPSQPSARNTGRARAGLSFFV